ncbi:MAG: tRNA (N6-isopentenyl adenosine(37)-C2)-methylthiotransferase MiaB [Treponema sp.]|nr:tRNA (N6-isopentenyl adenosine(37)-C2)-methylthiotransferase MiaB [Treponema sp.]
MTYFFETYGCQMNLAESAAVEQLFLARGWTKAEDAETADIAIINTCSVRATAENRVFGRLGWYVGVKAVRECRPDAKTRSLEKAASLVKDGVPRPLTLVVMGCMAERLLKTLKRDYPVVDYVVGTFAKKQFADIIAAVENHDSPINLDDSGLYQFASVSYEQGSFTTFVPIMHGCNNFCTYCIVPYVRGRELSRPVSEILKEIDVLSSYGVKEITLLGQNVNSYNGPFEANASNGELCSFPRLMQTIADHLAQTKSPIGWVRFVSSHPKDLSDELIDVIAKNPVLCRHIHLPIQHASNRMLKAMNRRYTKEDYLALVDRIRSRIPDVSMTTDVMVGFPGETEEDVQELIDLMKTVRYESAFMYYYNPREGTPACTMDNQVPIKVKKDRLQRIIDLQLQITQEEMAKRTGRDADVLVESISRDNSNELLGKTAQDERVAFAADAKKIGSFVRVHLDSLSGNTFRGTLL